MVVLALLGGFSSGPPVFLPPQKPTSSNSNSTWIEDPHKNQLIDADVASFQNTIVEFNSFCDT